MHFYYCTFSSFYNIKKQIVVERHWAGSNLELIETLEVLKPTDEVLLLHLQGDLHCPTEAPRITPAVPLLYTLGHGSALKK
jgi:hypothetical protein